MLEIETPAAMAEWVGRKLGTSEWFTVDQKTIDLFAEATGDHQWIHVDVERAAREMPGGKTIAHGFLTLSLLPRLAPTIYRIKQRSRALNYGTNKVRFTAMVPSGSRVRLHLTVKAVLAVAPLASARSTSCCEMLPKRPAGLEAWYAACAAPPSPPPSFAPPPQATRPIAIAESIVSRVKRVMRTPFLIEDLAPRPGREA